MRGKDEGIRMVKIKGVEIDRDCKGCLSCIFKWHGDGTNYCLAQSVKPFELHHINYFDFETRWEQWKFLPEAERHEKQATWREPSCPLVLEDKR